VYSVLIPVTIAAVAGLVIALPVLVIGETVRAIGRKRHTTKR
jgi:hypothetical protein